MGYPCAMTAQAMDTLEFDGRRWAICATRGEGMNVPTNEQLGIVTRMRNTADYSGRIDCLAVRDGHLVLAAIDANLTPEFADVTPAGATRTSVTRDGVVFEFERLIIPFTGTLILGIDLDWNYYVHMGYQSHNRFAKRAFLTFEAGALTGTRFEEGAYPDPPRE